MEPPFNQAEHMLRRVSPEGRALAYRERVEHQRRMTRGVGLCVLLAALLSLVLFGLAQTGIDLGVAPGVAALVIFILGCVAIAARTRRGPVRATQLPSVPLTALPLRTSEWLEQQRSALPAPSLPIVDSLTRHLSGLGPQLGSLEPGGAGAGAIRKLIAVELPELIERYRNIPALVAKSDSSAQLIEGLKIIDGEIGRMSNDLASGSFDALATQNRYLQLKYDAGLGTS